MSITVAIKALGSKSALAAAVGVSPQMVSQWVSGKRPISAAKARAIEIATDGAVKRHQLRPDIFDAPRRGKAA